MKVDAIFCADLHLREDVPVCRTDDYLKEQRKKLSLLLSWQKDYECPIFIAGDIFDKAKLSKTADCLFMREFNSIYNPVYVIPGNHDLPNHNIDNMHNSTMNVMFNGCDKFYVYGNPLENICIIENIPGRKIGLVHKLLHKDNPIISDGITISSSAKRFLRKNPDIDVILSGDNHATFIETYEDRLLVNPGSMMRMTAAQEKHKPCIFLYNAKTNTVQPKYFPIKKGVITREHIEIQEKYNIRMDKFINSLSDDVELGISFEKNIEICIKKNKIKKAVQTIMWDSVEGE